MISETGYWSDDEAKFHVPSPALAEILIKYLDKDKLVIDYGCGDGYYLDRLQKNGFKKVLGIDGFKIHTYKLEEILIADLSQPIFLDRNGQVICLEVGEHLPKQYEETFLDNVTRHCDSKLVLSWAIKGQPGIGHVNCQNNDYIIHEIKERGFKYDETMSTCIREKIEEETYWFRNTLMIFNKV